ncbi:SPOR domain-containing protein [Halobacillus sp. ACCC02827]|uniref:SPOR domain-containing protein n=1 Tax=Halobacillus sp. ACCC02827 TaxID=3052090 RepID=UPI00257049BF|nr:SPOR domain-containing protein [Halobacillus sp. ACCC02827]WJE14533.1 SPOR domain-containing protein [Halobacillus sp. ACCC02827]
MDSKKKISISFRNDENNEWKKEVVRTQVEQAAAVKEEEDNSGERTTVYHLPAKKKLFSFPVRHIAATLLVALVVSLGIGFVLLRVFVSLTESGPSEAGAGQAANGPGPAVEVAGDKQPDAASGGGGTFEAYIVQAGAFSTEGKAEEWKSRLNAIHVPSVIWERDGQFFLFVGSAATKADADAIAAKLSEKSVDTYVKPFVVQTDKPVPEELEADLRNHTLNELTESERSGLLDNSEKGSPLKEALQGWESQDDADVNWLKVARALE